MVNCNVLFIFYCTVLRERHQDKFLCIVKCHWQINNPVCGGGGGGGVVVIVGVVVLGISRMASKLTFQTEFRE